MDERKEKKGFWAGLLRNSSLAKKVANPLVRKSVAVSAVCECEW